MKKTFWILLGILLVTGIIVLGYFLKKNSTPPTTPPRTEISKIQTVTQCYTYQHVATKEAPYDVNEKVEITIGNEIVTGTKTGFQSGPDMTNGYEGTITGTQTGDTLVAIFAYTIEGSTINEQEEYILTPISLIKHRYPLKDQDGILVPDTTGVKQEMVYTRTTCTA
jgi:hypothetical protein